ncbi:SDR family NAD(P)-dependent oxidoreductase [Kaistia dalseonensis]|uniref:3-oxoacyl-[acyl-carrier protein] reductase n=1 Tax=Kaistia dalseonensis TaxID=410840 RepID=A0ABU0H8T6_9HYPH|nr:SDR family NAD(P)-dependent oxidoreductase [Kaistia dalseonensis]MCX5496120.1 SDR family NAD(P)-dependent oxidoreductase [Kaistia dalseonensis]MDQ0438728.1 3-oxoacyl-[acyl-carrier protein] reductase [Kaistia dalseonensis]
MGKLDGRRAVVTGGASGIGRGIAELFAREGAVVAILDRNEAQAEAVAEGIRAAGGAASAFACDVSDENAVATAFALVKAEIGAVDILVNNAGILRDVPFEELSITEWDRMIATNLRSVFLCTRQVIGGMRARKWGRIINTASQLGHKGSPMLVHYASAKAGVIGFTKSLGHEVARDGVTVNAIAPGVIETPMGADITPAGRAAKEAELPIGRFGRVDEVVEAALLLASDAGSYFIGSTVNMNGGDYMI